MAGRYDTGGIYNNYTTGGNWQPSSPLPPIVPVLSSAPNITIEGAMYYDTTQSKLGIYVNGSWTYR